MSRITPYVLQSAIGLLAAVTTHASAQEAPPASTVTLEVGYSAMDSLLGRQRVWAVHRLEPGMLRESRPGDTAWIRLSCPEHRPCELEVLARAPDGRAASTDSILTGVVMTGDDEGVVRAVRLDQPIEVRDDALFQQLAFQADRIKVVVVGISTLAGRWAGWALRLSDVKPGQPLRWK